MSVAAEFSPPVATRGADPRHPNLLDAIRWEASKLAAQARARFTLLACLLAPALIVVVINGQQRPAEGQPVRSLHPRQRLRRARC